MIATHPFLPVMYLPDLGEDKLHLYNIGTNGSLTNLTTYQQPYGSGPRHLAITASGKYMYLLHELSTDIRPYKIDQSTGELCQIQDELVATKSSTDVVANQSTQTTSHIPPISALLKSTSVTMEDFSTLPTVISLQLP